MTGVSVNVYRMAEGSKDSVCFVLTIAVWLQGNILWLYILIQLTYLFPWDFPKLDELELNVCVLLTCTECGKYTMLLNILLRFSILVVVQQICVVGRSYFYQNTQLLCQDFPCTDSEAFYQISKCYLHCVDTETVQEEVICLVFWKLRMEPEFLLLFVPYSLNDTIFLK